MAERIWATFQGAYRIEAALLGVDSFPPLERSIDSIQGAGSCFWYCEGRNCLAGVLEVEGTTSGLSICSLAVAPEFFRQGVASALLSHLLRAKDSVSVSVQTAVLNTPAISLYKRFGFKESKSWTSNDGIELTSLQWSQSQ